MADPNVSTGPGALGVNRIAYEFDFFSGSQISIYIGNILIDDIDSIQFTVTQTKRPIYGYASQYFHTVADGQVLVEGVFAIPFKEADYILAALKNHLDVTAPVEDLDAIGGPLIDPNTRKAIPTSSHAVLRENIERYLQRLTGDTYTGIPYELAHDLSALSDEAFENAAEHFEDVLWKRPKEKFLEPNLSPTGFDLGDYTRRGDQFPPFDIYILYGDITNKAANHTLKRLIDVSIIGQGQAIVVGGEPIREQYRFIARNLG
jgi:hypothetical protein